MAKKEIVDANIKNSVNPEDIREKILAQHDIQQLIKSGEKLLEETNRPNIITLEEFEPYRPLFSIDSERLETDEQYKISMFRMYENYRRNLSINIYQPTVVIQSRENQVEVLHLRRVFTQIAPDTPPSGTGLRDTIPAAVQRGSYETRDMKLLDASLADLMAANSTEEQKAAFRAARVETALFDTLFVRNNLNEQKRKDIMGENKPEESSGSAWNNVTLDDEDD